MSKLRDMTERLFQEVAEQPLPDWVAERRNEGATWRQIERDLRDEAGIQISNVTLIAWYGNDRAVA